MRQRFDLAKTSVVHTLSGSKKLQAANSQRARFYPPNRKGGGFTVDTTREGFTLIEVVLVIAAILLLSTAFVAFNAQAWGNYVKGRQAGDTLRLVEHAQRMYAADNPGMTLAALTWTNLQPYLPGGVTPTLPQPFQSQGYTINIQVQPPRVRTGAGVNYDPSGSTSDGIWDAGQ